MSRVLILGLGQYPQGSGVEAAVFFAERGHDVVATDLKNAEDLARNVKRLSTYPNVRLVLGEHRLEDVRWADIVVPNPRVRPDSPYFQEALKHGKRIESDVSVFLEACPAAVVGVTGTRGKSTTTTLIAEMLKADERTVWVGGNILVSPLAFLKKVKKSHWVVLELSSWQLELTGRKGISPAYAVWTNLMRDHLNTYSGMEEYAEAKAQIFRHQGPGGVVFLPKDKYFNAFAETAPGEVVRTGTRNSQAGALVKATKMRIGGEHNQRNAEIAVTVAQRLGVKDRAIKKVLRTFSGLPNRQEEIGVVKGVHYINDTTATTPDATIAALKAFAPQCRKQGAVLHLIFGGADKELEFEEVARLMKRLKPAIHLLAGTAHEKIAATFKTYKVSYQDAASLDEAMEQIRAQVQRGDVVLLSPGCASFGLFKNEFHRGEEFIKRVRSLQPNVQTKR